MKTFLYIFALILTAFCKIEYEKYNSEHLEDFEELKSSQCLATNEQIKSFLSNHNISYNETDYDNKLRFIVSPCSPIVLIPGIYSTKLKVKLNCKNLNLFERDTLKKIRIFCSDFVCSDDDDTNENRELWFNLALKGFDLGYNIAEPKIENDELNDDFREKWDWDNRHSACLGYFMTIFNNKEECPIIDGERGEKRICGHSENIKISFEGGFYSEKENSECGVKAVENILYSNTIIKKGGEEKTNVFGPFVSKLEEIGYEKGFSLAAVPNDFRLFISTNKFAFNALKYHIEHMYEITGKPVVIIAHSFGNLITLNTLKKEPSLKNKIKKWISLAPPFAGATKAIEYFLHGIKDFRSKILGGIYNTDFKLFGQYMMLKSIPTVYELKPFTLFPELFESTNEYRDFGSAIRERLTLEKMCRTRQCTYNEIYENSKIFNKYFSSYFPTLDKSQCKYEDSIGGNNAALYKRCMTDIFNIIDCPSIVKVSNSENKDEVESTVYDIEDFCDKSKETNEIRYFIDNCRNGETNLNYKCTDDLFPEIKNVFSNDTVSLDYFIRRFNKLYAKKFKNTEINSSYFETDEEVKLTIEKMLEYQKNISLIKDLPIPPVDIDIVYASFNPTLAAEFLDEKTLEVIDKSKGGEVTKGGDGTVPTWSTLLTAFKWIYEKETKNLTQNIRLIQYCSRLANSDLNIKNFRAISCKCLDSNNEYGNDLDQCGHQNMLFDDKLYEYIYDEINLDTNNETERTISEAIENYKNQNRDYMNECNEKLVIFNSDYSKPKCGLLLDDEITKEQYENGYCNDHYQAMEGYQCCGIYLQVIDDDSKFIDGYSCSQIKNDDEFKKFYKEFFVSNVGFMKDSVIGKMEFKCQNASYIKFKFILYILGLLIILF